MGETEVAMQQQSTKRMETWYEQTLQARIDIGAKVDHLQSPQWKTTLCRTWEEGVINDWVKRKDRLSTLVDYHGTLTFKREAVVI